MSGHLLSHSNSFGFEMEKDAAGCRALNRNFIVGDGVLESRAKQLVSHYYVSWKRITFYMSAIRTQSKEIKLEKLRIYLIATEDLATKRKLMLFMMTYERGEVMISRII